MLLSIWQKHSKIQRLNVETIKLYTKNAMIKKSYKIIILVSGFITYISSISSSDSSSSLESYKFFILNNLLCLNKFFNKSNFLFFLCLFFFLWFFSSLFLLLLFFSDMFLLFLSPSKFLESSLLFLSALLDLNKFKLL